MRGIPTGGVQDQAYRSAPAVLNTTVLIPNTTAIVMLTYPLGEYTIVLFIMIKGSKLFWVLGSVPYA